MTSMSTWWPVLEVRFGTSVESWDEQKAGLNSQHYPTSYFAFKKNQDPTFMIINQNLMGLGTTCES